MGAASIGRSCPFPMRAARPWIISSKQAAQYWLQLDNRQSQAHLALALNRFGDPQTARKIMASMKERSKVDEELGRSWAESEATLGGGSGRQSKPRRS